jgi:hypothetical protein
MKFTLLFFVFVCQVAQANPIFSVKERLRLHLWVQGLDEKPSPKQKTGVPSRPLPEELERALKKI